MDPHRAKQQAAEAALHKLPTSGIVGLGSGSTARLFIEGLGRLVQAGRDLVGVPTSHESRELAAGLGIRMLDDAGPWDIDVTVDGADEVSTRLHLIKGGGGCHTREKIVASSSRLNIVVVDESKLSTSLGERWPVPVEVLPFGRHTTVEQLRKFGQVTLRERALRPWMTDSGNYLFDVHAGVIDKPAELDAALCHLPGVVATGLFVGRTDCVIVS